VPGGGYSFFSGTSMAAPHVTGVVAMVYALNPTYTYGQVIQRIFDNVKPSSALSGITATGGIVNAFASINISPPLLPPVAPSGLLAAAVDEGSIDLSWDDNSDNEAVFVIERKEEGDYSEIGSVDSNVNSYTDNGLEASTPYCYRVKARNSAGDSGYTNESCDVTAEPPPFVDVVAGTQNIKSGTITSGSLSSTYINDVVYLTLQEKLSGGTPTKRKSFLEAVWTFQIPSGCGLLTLYANAFYSLNTLDQVNNNEDFVFQYWNGASWIEIFRINPLDSFDDTVNPYYAYPSLPPGAGPLTVRVVDSVPNTQGNNGQDRISIDHMFMRCE
jgi:hypothetical protein